MNPFQVRLQKKKGKEKWSTSKLYCVEIIEERSTDEVKVHYQGYDEKYDWKVKDDIVVREGDGNLSDAVALLRQELSIKIKESLNVLRLRNPEITLYILIQQETFEHLLSVINPDYEQRGEKTVYRCT